MKTIWHPFKFVSIALIFLFVSHCATVQQEHDAIGVQKGYESYVPAQVAVLPCRVWPVSAKLNFAPQITDRNASSKKDDQILCKAFDEFILSSFVDQPYMKGFAPKVVAQLLGKVEQDDFLDEMEVLWLSKPVECRGCSDELNCAACYQPLQHYNKAVSIKKSWQVWLNKLSRFTLYSDALLLPLIVKNESRQFSEKGLSLSSRNARVALFLIDTNTARVIWIGGRDAYVASRSAENHFPPMPSLEVIKKNLLNEQLLSEYPGRILY